ncbi:hypothetical protein P0136_00665 [Lentisphaerota bacterium ZTH]|nr:hypothetical protein JYG24_08190 [Lentisphaerota bacterium]WET06527.1 hypothetical protein P0136_00665 [Lentisphaerota bacterium ZTH]
MSRIILLAALALCLAASGCKSFDSKPTADTVMDKMQVSMDPQGKLDKVSCAVYHYKVKSGTQNAIMTMYLKSPDKIKFVTRFDDSVLVKTFDGKTGWEYYNKTGLRRLASCELDEIRLQGTMLSPCVRLQKIFKKMQLAGKTEAAGQECWKLVCLPLDKYKSQPIIFFISTKTGYLVKLVEEQDTCSETVEIKTFLGAYKEFEGIKVPTRLISQVNGSLVESTLQSVEWNCKLSDADFAPPQPMR